MSHSYDQAPQDRSANKEQSYPGVHLPPGYRQQQLIDRILFGSSEAESITAIRELTRSGAAHARTVLESVAMSPHSQNVRREAILGLGQVGSSTSIPLLAHLALKADHGLSAAAAAAIRVLKPDPLQYGRLFPKLLRSDRVDVRSAALLCICRSRQATGQYFQKLFSVALRGGGAGEPQYDVAQKLFEHDGERMLTLLMNRIEKGIRLAATRRSAFLLLSSAIEPEYQRARAYVHERVQQNATEKSEKFALASLMQFARLPYGDQHFDEQSIQLLLSVMLEGSPQNSWLAHRHVAALIRQGGAVSDRIREEMRFWLISGDIKQFRWSCALYAECHMLRLSHVERTQLESLLLHRERTVRDPAYEALLVHAREVNQADLISQKAKQVVQAPRSLKRGYQQGHEIVPEHVRIEFQRRMISLIRHNDYAAFARHDMVRIAENKSQPTPVRLEAIKLLAQVKYEEDRNLLRRIARDRHDPAAGDTRNILNDW